MIAAGPQQVALGFWETGVRFVYRFAVSLDGFVGDGTQVTLSARLWNQWSELSDTALLQADTTGMAVVRSWANPTFVGRASLKGDRWLRRVSDLSPIVNPFTDYPFAAFLLLPGDVTNHNRIDRLDYSAFKIAFGSRPGDDNWNPLADLDGDDVVGRSDYSLFKANFGQTGDE